MTLLENILLPVPQMINYSGLDVLFPEVRTHLPETITGIPLNWNLRLPLASLASDAYPYANRLTKEEQV